MAGAECMVARVAPLKVLARSRNDAVAKQGAGFE
jgi:hypothetical protein